MIFSIEEAKEILKRGESQDLPSALTYQSLLRVFTENKDFTELTKEEGFQKFRYRFNITDDSKRERIFQSVSYPLSSIEITQSASSEVSKIWEAKNRFFDIQTDNKGIKASIENIIAESKPYEFIKKHARHVLSSAPCSIVCIEYPEEGGTPYFNIIPIESVINLEVKGNDVKWIVFRGENGIKYFYDRKFRRAFDDKDNLIGEIEMPYERDPARFFLSDRVNSTNPLKRSGLFANLLSELSDFEMFNICHRYTEMYGAFPVIQKPESKCSNFQCEGGVILSENEEGEQVESPCTDCATRQDILPGTTVEIPAGLTTDEVSPVDVFRFIDPETKGLEYVKQRQTERRDNIYYSSVGVTKVLQKEAVNQSQVEGTFESRKNILNGIKKQLEELYKWMVESVSIDYYNEKVIVVANFGTEYYLQSEEDLQALLEQAKRAGTPENERENIYKQIIDTKYKGNETRINRAMILNEVNPLPFDTFTEVKEKLTLGVISRRDAAIWSNFTQLIKRFEREQGDILFFSDGAPLAIRVDRIKEIINKYIDEVEQSRGSEERASE